MAIKVLTKNLINAKNAKQDAVIKNAMDECRIMKGAEAQLTYKDCIVKVYGIANGPLPKFLNEAMKVMEGIEAVGIVMRYEGKLVCVCGSIAYL